MLLALPFLTWVSYDLKMDLDLAGKRVVVTGGANGIGLAATEAFRKEGAEVFVFDVASGFQVDVRDSAAVNDAFRRAGDVDVVVINAGIAPGEDLVSATDETWRAVLDVNLTGAFYTLRAAAQAMKPRRCGAIVLTASTNSWDGEAGLVAYNATKAGVLGLLHTAANELGPYGIRVNAVCPGLIRTRLTKSSFSNPDIVREYFRHIAMGRGGEPEEVANAIVFLASGAASYITGTTLVVDGGQLASKYSLWNESIAEFRTDHWELK